MPFDPATHRDYAQRVARPAAMMRRYLAELGLHHVPQPMRLRGARLDKSRILPLVTRGEPRVLLQRELETRTDLFIAIVIDCSGSMAARDNMERARQFGMLLAEACAGLTGVDLRVFGFTDKVIYDCGSAVRCAAYGLQANGGNNDAAALFYAANVARASRRRAKLLVMISDGLPTECSVAALRELVQTLTRRWQMVCAQVAVQPLSEVCFPHYVVCNDPTIEQTVTRFGGIVMNLVRRAIGR
jgi:cobalamin biosynthesis protein CobT